VEGEFVDFDAFLAEIDRVREARAARGQSELPSASLIVSDDDLARVEAQLQTRLPEKYKQFLRVFGGGHFAYLDLAPLISPDGRDRGLVELNAGPANKPGFVAIAPSGGGDYWGFVTVDGVCEDQVRTYSFVDGDFEFEADDFLTFASWQGLHGGRDYL
jgi:hypothetical protein